MSAPQVSNITDLPVKGSSLVRKLKVGAAIGIAVAVGTILVNSKMKKDSTEESAVETPAA